MDIKRFFDENLSSPYAAFHSDKNHLAPVLPEEVRQAANRGWRIFPVSQVARLTADRDSLIDNATCDVSRLAEFAAHYPLEWRVAIGPSSLCVLHIAGPEGRESVAALSQDDGECLTLQTRCGDVAWAFFRWPTDLVRKRRYGNPSAGLRVLGPDDSCILPPSAGCRFTNPWADVESVPYWLRTAAFEPTAASRKSSTGPLPARCAVSMPSRRAQELADQGSSSS